MRFNPWETGFGTYATSSVSTTPYTTQYVLLFGPLQPATTHE